jgi:hypothetical protein
LKNSHMNKGICPNFKLKQIKVFLKEYSSEYKQTIKVIFEYCWGKKCSP